MTSDHPLRRALARICSAVTMSRIVDPVLADMHWEDGRATLRGCAALAKALVLYAITSTPGWFVAAVSDDHYALPRAAAFTAVGAVAIAVALTLSPLAPPVARIHISLYARGIRFIPQALFLSLPSMLVLTIPVMFGRPVAARSIVGRVLLLTIACLAISVALAVFVIPRGHQSYRELPNGGSLGQAPTATGFAALRAQIRDFDKTDGGQSLAQRLEYGFQLRVAVMVSAGPFSIAGLAIAALARRRPAAIAMALCGLSAYWGLVVAEEHVANALIIHGGFLPEYLCAWTPNLLIVIASFAILGVRSSGDLPSNGTVS